MILFVVFIALAGAVPVVTAQAPADNVHAADGLVLPRDHQYERYDSNSKAYSRVDVDRVPELVRRNVAIYDRTAGAWVFAPKQGINPRYASAGAGQAAGARAAGDRGRGNWERGAGNWDRNQGGWARVNGTVTAINGDQVTIRENGGREVIANMSEARTRLRGGLKVGDRVSIVGTPTGPDRLNARALRERGTGGKAAQGGEQDDDWQHIHGRVQSVQGDTMRFRTDDGRALTVDLSPVGQEIRQALQQGEGATVIGYEWTGPNRLRAEYVQQDTSDPSRGGAIAPSASPPGSRR
jgi:hypothetical protein